MTQLAFKRVKCAVCGKICSVTEINSTNEFGSPDLDTRPAEMARSAIKGLVQVCTGCTYCSDDLSKIEPELAPLVYSQAYRDIFGEVGFSANASYWRCKAWLEEKQEKYAEAFWSTMNAAWDCDDHEVESTALKSRGEAIAYYKSAQKHEQSLTEDPAAAPLILMDLYRRIRDRDGFERTIKRYSKKIKDPLHKKIMAFQAYLMNCYDCGSYTLDDAGWYCDHRAMYLLHVPEDEYKAVIKQKCVKQESAHEQIITGDILLFRHGSQISHAATMDGMMIIDVSWPVPDDLIYGDVITFTNLSSIKPPLHLHDILPDDASVKYLYFDTCKKVNRQDQKFIEEFLKI